MAGNSNPLRQQMINMMYLVLTALLALNVSADILKAFALVNGALENTNAAYQSRNDLTMKQFAKVFKDDPGKAKFLYANAQKAEQLGAVIYADLQKLKEDMAFKADGWVDSSKKAVINDQDLEIAHNYLINEKRAVELRNKLIKFEDEMKKLLIDEKGNPTPGAVTIEFDTDERAPDKEGVKKAWEEYYFGGVPVIAAITEVTKFQNEVRNTVGEVENYLFKQVGADVAKLDQIAAIVTSPTPAVYSGDKYTAEILLGAYSSTQTFEAYVNGQPLKVEGGKAKYETTGSGIGDKKIDVKIRYKDGKGEWKEVKTEAKYNVFTGSATISADKMNMLYVGLENPISVSVPGFRPDQISVSASAGLNLRKNGNSWMARPNEGVREGTVTVTADGKKVGSMNYRVRPVPNPEVLLGSKTGGSISKGELLAMNNVFAGLGASFAFEGLNYKIQSFTAVFAPKSGQVQAIPAVGNAVPGQIKAAFNSAKPGDLVIIAEVKAVGPDGKIKQLNGPTFTVR